MKVENPGHIIFHIFHAFHALLFACLIQIVSNLHFFQIGSNCISSSFFGQESRNSHIRKPDDITDSNSCTYLGPG